MVLGSSVLSAHCNDCWALVVQGTMLPLGFSVYTWEYRVLSTHTHTQIVDGYPVLKAKCLHWVTVFPSINGWEIVLCCGY
jgi:hypothetical protein